MYILNPFTYFDHSPNYHPSGNHQFVLHMSVSLLSLFWLLEVTYKWDCICLWYISLSIIASRFIHVVVYTHTYIYIWCSLILSFIFYTSLKKLKLLKLKYIQEIMWQCWDLNQSIYDLKCQVNTKLICKLCFLPKKTFQKYPKYFCKTPLHKLVKKK